MDDRDSLVLEALAHAVSLIDRKYRRASAADKLSLKGPRDEAFNAYRSARVELLADGVIATAADVTKMKEIKTEIARARATQTVVAGVVKLVAFAAKFV